MRKLFYLLLFISTIASAQQQEKFNGLNMNLGNLFRLSDAKTRSISPENLTGEPGKGGMATLENGVHYAARELTGVESKSIYCY
jgi:hypothetical protein